MSSKESIRAKLKNINGNSGSISKVASEQNLRKRKALGRGLSSLLGESKAGLNQRINEVENFNPDRDAIHAIDLSDIEAGIYQPRLRFSDTELRELSDSIKEHGVLQPIIVRKSDKEGSDKVYEIIAGERRFRASRMAGLDNIPAIIKTITDLDALSYAIIENIQREDLNPLEEAKAFKRFMDEFTYTQEKVAEILGKSRSYVANSVRLLNLPESVRNKLSEGLITVGHAKAIAKSNNIDEILEEIIDGSLNVRETEKLVKKLAKKLKEGDIVNGVNKLGFTTISKDEITREKEAFDSESIKEEYLRNFEKEMNSILELKIEAFYDLTSHEGQIIIDYSGLDSLDKILQKLKMNK